MEKNKKNLYKWIVFETNKTPFIYDSYPDDKFPDDTCIIKLGCSCHINRLNCGICNDVLRDY